MVQNQIPLGFALCGTNESRADASRALQQELRWEYTPAPRFHPIQLSGAGAQLSGSPETKEAQPER